MIFVNSRFLTQNITGVQRCAVEISKQLQKLYPDVYFISSHHVIQKEQSRLLDIVTFGKLNGHLWEQAELPIYLRLKKYPLLVNLANTAPLLYKNQIITIHDLAFLRNPSWFSRKFYYCYKYLIPKIAENSLKIVTVSEFSKKEIMSLLNISESKIKVIFNAVSNEFFNMAKTTARRKDENYILSVSSMDPRKNIKNLLIAFNRMNLGDVKLIVAGSENKIFAYSELHQLISANDNIFFTGHVSDRDMVRLYKSAKLFIYPSLYEGFGLPPLEAMACGCPVITSNTASLPDVCGDAAYYVDPLSIDSIIEGIRNVMENSNLRQDLIKKGKERVKLFSWEKSAGEYIKVIEEVLGR